MPEPVKRSVIEKINHTQQGLQRTKWQPKKEAIICNVHYPDFKGPTRVNPDVLPIYFKRPTSYPAAISVPMKRRLLERRSPPVKAPRSRVIDHSQDTQHSSEDSVSEQHAHHNTDISDSEQHIQQNTELADSEQHTHHNTEISDTHMQQTTELADSEQHTHYNTEISDMHMQQNTELADSEQYTHHNTEISDSEQHMQQSTEVADSDLQVPCEFSEQGRPDPLRGDYSVERLLQENRELHLENAKLKEHIQFLNTHLQRLDVTLLNDCQVNMYTGISRKLFDCIDHWLQPVSSKQRANEVLSPTQKLLLVLMRIRHNHAQSDLACCFNVEQSSVSCILNHWIPFLSAQFKRLIQWPQTCIGPSVAPYDLLPNSVAIIDGTEIFIQRPSNLATQKSSYSDYKSHTTVKYLVAIDTFTGVPYIAFYSR